MAFGDTGGAVRARAVEVRDCDGVRKARSTQRHLLRRLTIENLPHVHSQAWSAAKFIPRWQVPAGDDQQDTERLNRMLSCGDLLAYLVILRQ